VANTAGVLENDDGRVDLLVVGFEEHGVTLVVVTDPGVRHLAGAAFSCAELGIANCSGWVDAEVGEHVGSAPPRRKLIFITPKIVPAWNP